MSSTHFSPDAILSLASALRSDGFRPAFCFDTDQKPFEGGESVVYAVKFPDNATWAIRVPVHAGKSLSATSLSAFVDTQAKMLTKLHESGFRWSPKLINYDAGHDNSIGHPYFVLSWIPGTALEWTDTSPPSSVEREKILHQIVNIQLELAECTRNWCPSNNHQRSALGFVTEMVDGKIMRAMTETPPIFDVGDCLVHRILARHAVSTALDPEPPVYAISHENLAAHNIIVDNEFNIAGIVDWSFARLLPLQLAFRLPRFLAIEPDSPMSRASQIPADIPAFSTQYLQPSSTLAAGRHVVLSYLDLLLADVKARQPAHEPFLPVMKTVLSNPNVYWRYLVIEACFSKGLHAWLARRNWLLHGAKGELAGLTTMSQERIPDEVDRFFEGDCKKQGVTRDMLLRKLEQ